MHLHSSRIHQNFSIFKTTKNTEKEVFCVDAVLTKSVKLIDAKRMEIKDHFSAKV
jgi:hypothetical protein